jgi:hypothetical protein
MMHVRPLPRVSRERPLFTWLARLGVLANALVAALILYFYFHP